jgi:hypothetical protein
MTFEYILELATQYENRHGLSLAYGLEILDKLENAIGAFLRGWVETIPEGHKILLRDRITRPIEYIKGRRFHLDYIWLNVNEIRVKVTSGAHIEMYISVNPKYIIVGDSEFGMREIAFPVVWSTT